MIAELIGITIFILTSLLFLWGSKMAGQGVAMTLGLGHFALSRQVAADFSASGWKWSFLLSLLSTVIGLSALIYGGGRMFYIALVIGNAILIICVSIVLTLCCAYFVRGFASQALYTESLVNRRNVDAIERLRKSKGRGIQVGSAPATAWWERLFRRKVTGAGNSDMPLKLKVAPLSPTRPCPYLPDAPSSPGMSAGILRPILRPLAARGRSDRWPR